MGSALSLMPEPDAPRQVAVFDARVSRLAPLAVTLDALGPDTEEEPCVWIGVGVVPARGARVWAIGPSDSGTYLVTGKTS